MTCPHCQGLESLFDKKTATKELKDYRKKGPEKSTRLLIEALKDKGVKGATLLDIGGGVGAIQHELLQAGAIRATNVDASTAYLEAAQEEAQRLGLAERVSYHYGNFVELAPDLASAKIVTLDRAVCCYPDMPTLVGLSAEKAEKLYGLVYPKDTWWLKVAAKVMNFVFWLERTPYRFFVHPTEAVESVVQGKGLQRIFYKRTFLWQIVVYGR